jgi:hypothetical protein
MSRVRILNPTSIYLSDAEVNKISQFLEAEGYENRNDATRALIYMGARAWDGGTLEAPSTQEIAMAFADAPVVELDTQAPAGNLSQNLQVRFSPEQMKVFEKLRHESRPPVKPQVIIRQFVDEGIKRYRRRLAQAKARRAVSA